MTSETTKTKNLKVSLPVRVDTFNLNPILEEIGQALIQTPAELVINLSETRFVNLPFIKRLAQLAMDGEKDSKKVVLLNASEKIKMQIGIFSDIKIFEIRRAVSKREWPELDENTDF